MIVGGRWVMTCKPFIPVLGAGGQVSRYVVEHLARCSEEVAVRITAASLDKVASLRAEGHDAVLLDLDHPIYVREDNA